jgi:hypothetical protein
MSRTAVLCLLIGLALKSNASQQHDASPVVRTVHGTLRGSVIQSRLGRSIYSFRGVRFAQPPVGDLRFKVRSAMAYFRNLHIAPDSIVLRFWNEEYRRDTYVFGSIFGSILVSGGGGRLFAQSTWSFKDICWYVQNRIINILFSVVSFAVSA